MRQFVHEIADHLLINYLDWDLVSAYSVSFNELIKGSNPGIRSFVNSIDLMWSPFFFYPTIFARKPAGLTLTRKESIFLYKTVMEMKKLKSLLVMKQLNGK